MGVDGVNGAKRGDRRRGRVDGINVALVLHPLEMADGVPVDVPLFMLHSISTVELTHLSASAFIRSVFCRGTNKKLNVIKRQTNGARHTLRQGLYEAQNTEEVQRGGRRGRVVQQLEKQKGREIGAIEWCCATKKNG